MSLFITRDYGSPRVLAHTIATARKNLTKKVFGTTFVDGIEVFNKYVHFYSNNKGRNPSFFPPISDYPAFRSDKLIKRWYNAMGISLKDMRAQRYSKVNDMFWRFNPDKWVASYEDPSTMPNNISTSFNTYAENMLSFHTSGAVDYYYGNEQAPNSIIASLPFNTTLDSYYRFMYLEEEVNLTGDGYFSIDSLGNIRVTLLGIKNGVVDYSHTNSNTRTYAIKKVYKDGTSEISYVNLHVKREYIDIRIVVGGEYVTKPEVVDSWIMEDSVNTNTLTPLIDLAAVRTAVESDPLLNLANLYPSEDDNMGGMTIIDRLPNIAFKEAYLYTPTAGVSYMADYETDEGVLIEGEGHVFDTLAVLDDGTIFEVITPFFNEKLELVEKFTGVYNLEYSYVKRYRVKAFMGDRDVLHANILDGLQRIHDSLNVYASNASKTAVMEASATGAIDSTIIEALYKINGWDNLELTEDYFYKGYLKVSAFDSMLPYAFDRFLAKCFDQKVNTKKTTWYNKALGIVIAYTGLALVIVGAILTFIIPPLGLALMAAGMALLVFGGGWYAREIGWGPGIKLIGIAAQVSAVVVAVTVLVYTWGDFNTSLATFNTVMGAIESGALTGAAAGEALAFVIAELAVSAVALAGAATSLAVSTGIIEGDSDFASAMALTSAIVTLGAQSYTTYANGIQFNGLSDLKLSDISGFMKTANTGLKGYTAYGELVQNSSKQPASEDHNTIESDGVNPVYLVQEKIFENDALENMEIYRDNAFGVNSTRLIIAGQML